MKWNLLSKRAARSMEARRRESRVSRMGIVNLASERGEGRVVRKVVCSWEVEWWDLLGGEGEEEENVILMVSGEGDLT